MQAPHAPQPDHNPSTEIDKIAASFHWFELKCNTLTRFCLYPTSAAIQPSIEWPLTWCCWSGASTGSTCGGASCPACPQPDPISCKCYKGYSELLMQILLITFVIFVDFLVYVHGLSSWWGSQSSNQVGRIPFITIRRLPVIDFAIRIDRTHGGTLYRMQAKIAWIEINCIFIRQCSLHLCSLTSCH